MQFDRPDIIYRNGRLAQQYREQTSNCPKRYRQRWTVKEVLQLTGDLHLHDQHHTRRDDSGQFVTWTVTRTLGSNLSKQQALAILAAPAPAESPIGIQAHP